MVTRTRLAGLALVLSAAVGCREKGLAQADREGEAVGQRPPEQPAPPPPAVPETCPPSCPPPTPARIGRKTATSPIVTENQRPGDPLWRSGRQANNGEVELYLSTDSAMAGDSVGVRLSTDTPQQVSVEVFRLGYYAGAGARRVWNGGPFPAQRQPRCPRSPVTSRVECDWPDALKFTVDKSWVSGVYVVRVRRPDGFRRFAPFVVRDARAAEILFQPAFNTAQAYNGYGGESLYEDGSGTSPNGFAWEVSYDRPFKDDDGSGQVLRWERPFLRFLEKYGYDVTYATNLDFERYSDVLKGVGAFVHAGHDEYWTAEQRRQVDAAVASGETSLAYFGGNGAYWRVRVVSNAQSTPLRTVVCFKGEASDPQPGSTVRFRDDPNPQPENQLFGVMYDGWQLIPFSLIVSDPSHWLFEGTGLTRGAKLPGLVGYEFDRIFDNGATPAGLGIPFESPLVTAEGLPSRSHVVARTLPSGRLVFAAGSIYWPLGLEEGTETYDARVERMTRNVLERALSHRRAPRPLPALNGPFPSESEPDARWAQAVLPFAGVPGPGGWRDGPGDRALFNGPTGLAVSPTGFVLVADTNNHRVRLVAPDAAHTVTTVAGNGLPGARDGAGAQAMFRNPTGVAVGADGAFYVADSDNHVIRRIENNPPSYTVSTVAGAFRKQGFADGAPDAARFRRPTALAIDAQGANLYVADQAGNRIRRIQLDAGRTVSTVAGDGRAGASDAALGEQARFNNPSALAVSPDGELYALDGANQRLVRIVLDDNRPVTTLAGGAGLGFEDGSGAIARFRAQMGMTFSPFGEVILADTGNFRVRKVVLGADAASTRVYTHAGSGQLGTSLGSGETADLGAPAGLVYLPNEQLVVSDSFQNTLRSVVR